MEFLTQLIPVNWMALGVQYFLGDDVILATKKCLFLQLEIFVCAIWRLLLVSDKNVYSQW